MVSPSRETSTEPHQHVIGDAVPCLVSWRAVAPARNAHPQLCGHHVQLLGAQLVDHMQRAAAAGAVAALDVDHHLVARQVRADRAPRLRLGQQRSALHTRHADLHLEILPGRPDRRQVFFDRLADERDGRRPGIADFSFIVVTSALQVHVDGTGAHRSRQRRMVPLGLIGKTRANLSIAS